MASCAQFPEPEPGPISLTNVVKSPPPGSKTRRVRRGRSSTGCLTCREKKVKCDEQQPVCQRCTRVQLLCRPASLQSPPSSSISRQSRRKAWGLLSKPPITRILLKPPPTPSGQEKADATCISRSNLDVESSTRSTTTSVAMLSHGVGNVRNLELTLPEYPDSPLSSTSHLLPASTREGNQTPMAECAENDEPDDIVDVSSLDALYSFEMYADTMFDFTDPSASATSSQLYRDPGLYALELPSEISVSVYEHYALEHYRTALVSSQTSKDPRWSFPNLLLRQISQSKMAMEFVLAASFQDMASENQLPSSLNYLAEDHFARGNRFLEKILLNQASYDPISLMASFYFAYLYLLAQMNLDVARIGELSQRIVKYLKRDKLEILLMNSASETPFTDITSELITMDSAASRSLLARLIFWLYKEDVQSSFYGSGGWLASYFKSKEGRLGEIWHASKSTLMLNWGVEYPYAEIVKDLEASEPVDFLVKLTQLQFEICQSWNSSSVAVADPIALKPLYERLNQLEIEYASIFQLASMAVTSAIDMVAVASSSAGIFHATRILLAQANSLLHNKSGAQASTGSFMQLLRIAQRLSTAGNRLLYFNRFQWALFIAGLETDDFIHSDWIMGKISDWRLRLALQNALNFKATTGKKISIDGLFKQYHLAQRVQDQAHEICNGRAFACG